MKSLSPIAEVVQMVCSEERRAKFKNVIHSKNLKGVESGTKPLIRYVRSTDPASFESAPKWVVFCCYLSYLFLYFVGKMNDLFFGMGARGKVETEREGYAPLYASFESFYTRHIFRRFKDVAFQPICSVPGATTEVLSRVSYDEKWSFQILNQKTKCINLGSYNYLGYSENKGVCTEGAIAEISLRGLTHCSPSNEYGTHYVQRDLESTVAKFLGVEDSITFGMGFATNTLNIPSLFDSNTLVLSDALNHASLILGLRLAKCYVKVFKHNDPRDLERLLRQSLIHGHTKTRRPWKKVVIMVEGVYSMEGSIVCLPEILALKKKYGAYIYLDEAHSVGAMGPRGRGVVDYFGLNPGDIDIMMGTFTKSFGAAGGYIAGKKELINFLRIHSHAHSYSSSISPPVAKQIIQSMRCIMCEPGYPNGLVRVQTLAKNTRYFRRKLHQMGFIIYGHNDSPVVPLLLFNPSKIRAFVHELLLLKIATVTVGFPGIPLTKERARFCLSAGHTREMVDEALEAVKIVGDKLNLRISKIPYDPHEVINYD